MKDTIYRQDAIDALYHVDEYNGRSIEAIRNLSSVQPEQSCVLTVWGECSYAETGCSDCEIKARITKALFPSAQPDLSEYSDKLWRNAYERGKRDAQPEQPYSEADIQKIQDLEQVEIQKAYELGKLDAEPQWIPCSERLPDITNHHTSEPCIVYCDNEAYAFAELEENIFGQVGWDCERDDDYHEPVGVVLAWMPLPAPYQGEGNQDE